MSKKNLLILLFVALSGFGFYHFRESKPVVKERQHFSTKEVEAKIDQIYEGISGFGIPDKEVKFIKKAGGAATYGEIQFASAQKLLDHFKLTKEDVFYDLGSGVGKFVLHTYLATDVKKSCGIELSGTRYELSVKAFNKAKKMNLFDSRELLFLNEDIIKADLSDATVVFMCATCYSDDLMKKIADKLVSIGSKVRIASLREFKNEPRLEKVETFKLPMTWSKDKGSPVHIYKIATGKKKKS